LVRCKQQFERKNDTGRGREVTTTDVPGANCPAGLPAKHQFIDYFFILSLFEHFPQGKTFLLPFVHKSFTITSGE